MRHASFSHSLFGRNHALLVYEAIAGLQESEFTTGELVRLTAVSPPLISKELGKLVDLRLIERLDFRGTYRRYENSTFWAGITLIASRGDES
jgi:DNA-binding transcriptional ArsR family regulator